jgi:1-acyl-sn-glycerol-3-phosphate acyltransferase
LVGVVRWDPGFVPKKEIQTMPFIGEITTLNGSLFVNRVGNKEERAQGVRIKYIMSIINR